jgi:uncharacterized protein (DUF952 family)
MTETIYKVARANEWRAALAAGRYLGSAHDQRDGFIHLATDRQLAGVLQRYFAGEAELLLLAVEVDRLTDLRWEPGRSDVFPHHYGALPLTALRVVLEGDAVTLAGACEGLSPKR